MDPPIKCPTQVCNLSPIYATEVHQHPDGRGIFISYSSSFTANRNEVLERPSIQELPSGLEIKRLYKAEGDGNPDHEVGDRQSEGVLELPRPTATTFRTFGHSSYQGKQMVFNPIPGGKPTDWSLCMPIAQIGNERCTGPPFGHSGPRPSDDCEVYIGQLSKDVYENRIYAVFSEIGNIFRIRIVTTGRADRFRSLGYGYVHFYHKQAADRAVAELTGYKFRGQDEYESGMRIKQITQIKRLFLTGVPKGMTPSRILEKFRENKCGAGLVDLIVPGLDRPSNGLGNRGYCFLEFKDHLSALTAWQWILKLQPLGPCTKTNWALPQTPKPEDLSGIGKYVNHFGTNLRTSFRAKFRPLKDRK